MEGNFLQYLILLLIALLFGKDTLLPPLLKKLGLSTGKTEVSQNNAVLRNELQTLLSQMELLATYFNHDTTATLKEMHDLLTSIQDCVKAVHTKLNEIKEYGVKIRP